MQYNYNAAETVKYFVYFLQALHVPDATAYGPVGQEYFRRLNFLSAVRLHEIVIAD